MAPRVQIKPSMLAASLAPRFAAVTAPMTFGASRDDGTPLGDYRVLDMIATGGMGGVYLAEDARGRRFALKVLDPQFAAHDEIVDRMAAEHEVSRRAPHPGLVQIHACFRPRDEQPYLVMELIDGENLATLLERGTFELGAIAAIGAQLAAALAAMHAAGIAHCDVKPDNVMVVYEDGVAGWPKVKLGDFGVARFFDDPSDEMSIAGTPPYMAPEQWSGEVDARTDIYALGCTLYELITGEPPFNGSLAAIATAHAEQRPVRPGKHRPAVPAALERIVMRMLAKDPALRPRTAEIVRELTEIAYGWPPSEDLSLYPCVA